MNEKGILVVFVALVAAGCGANDNPSAIGYSGKGEDAEQRKLSPEDEAELNQFMAGTSGDGTVLSCEFKSESIPVQRAGIPDYEDLTKPPVFTFCPNPPVASDTKLNLTNAAWLAYFAAMEYGHLAVINPEFRLLGFGNEVDDTWTDRAVALRLLRRLECIKKERSECAEDVFDSCQAPCLPPTLDTGDALVAAAMDASCGDRFVNFDNERRILEEILRPWFQKRLDTARSSDKLSVIERAMQTAGISARFQQDLIARPNTDNMIKYFSGEDFRTEDGTKTFDEGSTQLVWAEHPGKNVIIIAFRGTEPKKVRDILADANFLKTPLSEAGWSGDWGEVHSGFLKAYNSVRTPLLTVTSMLRTRTDRPAVWVTGHSLGGALATLFASKLLEIREHGHDINFKGVYTFGSPRVGNEAFARKLNKTARDHNAALMRFKHGTDIVTRVPKWNYEHVGQTVHLDARNHLYQIGPEDDGEHDWDTAIIGSAGDHSMEKYLKRTKEALKSAQQSGLTALVDCQ